MEEHAECGYVVGVTSRGDDYVTAHVKTNNGSRVALVDPSLIKLGMRVSLTQDEDGDWHVNDFVSYA